MSEKYPYFNNFIDEVMSCADTREVWEEWLQNNHLNRRRVEDAKEGSAFASSLVEYHQTKLIKRDFDWFLETPKKTADTRKGLQMETEIIINGQALTPPQVLCVAIAVRKLGEDMSGDHPLGDSASGDLLAKSYVEASGQVMSIINREGAGA